MTQPAGDGDEPLSREDLCRVEARVEARLQEVLARLVLHDGRFAAMNDRVNQADRRADTFGARLDSELVGVDRRFDRLDSRLDDHDTRSADVRAELIEAVRHNRAALCRTTILGLGATVAVTAVLVGSTMWILL